MRLPLFAATLLLAAAALPAHAQSTGEHLLAVYPSDWHYAPLASRNPNVQMTRLLPPGQSPQNYSEAIVVERYSGSSQSAQDFVGTLIQVGRQDCAGFTGDPAKEANLNGYTAVVARYGCTRGTRTGKSGMTMVIAISGNEALHVIQTMWLGPPVAANQAVPIPDEVLHRWKTLASHVVLCDSRDPNHPCPAGAVQ